LSATKTAEAANRIQTFGGHCLNPILSAAWTDNRLLILIAVAFVIAGFTAQALLDILELSPSLEALVGLTRPGGLVYLPITFDGETIFEPGSSLDDAVLSAYHDTMEETGSSRTSRTGRRVFHALRSFPVEVLEIGSSDWIVHPVRGEYPGDEAFFLDFILKTIEGAVRERVERASLETRLSERRRQLESADLLYYAHQVDVLAQRAS